MNGFKWCAKCNTKNTEAVSECVSCNFGAFLHQDPVMREENLEVSNTAIPKSVNKVERKRDLVQGVYKPENPHTFDEKSIERLILAQNRTTHAVRAFVRFLFIQLTASTFAFFLWSFGTVQTQFLGIVVWIIGLVWSSNAGWGELEKSNID
jgi:hypothetical protein